LVEQLSFSRSVLAKLSLTKCWSDRVQLSLTQQEAKGSLAGDKHSLFRDGFGVGLRLQSGKEATKRKQIVWTQDGSRRLLGRVDRFRQSLLQTLRGVLLHALGDLGRAGGVRLVGLVLVAKHNETREGGKMLTISLGDNKVERDGARSHGSVL
jgi:hypothetical protein